MVKFLKYNSSEKVFEEQEETGGGGPATSGDVVSCDVSVSIGDAVYVSASDTVDKASAEVGVGQTEDAMGIVVEKPTTTTARIIAAGVTPDIYAGLTPKATYYVSDTTPGAITDVPPTATGAKLQEVGIALSSTKLLVGIERTSAIL